MPVSKKRYKKKRQPFNKNITPPKAATVTQDKLSEAIMKMAEPLLDRYHVYDSYNDTKKIIGFTIIAWNISLLPIKDRQIEKDKVIKSLSKKDRQLRADLHEIFDYLIHRKDTCFENDNRHIVDYQLTDQGDKYHLVVASTAIGDVKPSP
ncbi:MAG: hypothetical protein M0Z41_17375 [Peptococcaceae bacterium]|jgi:hypothetical protein|nr:hypothetical protein [Peptococcaceae bacterium]